MCPFGKDRCRHFRRQYRLSDRPVDDWPRLSGDPRLRENDYPMPSLTAAIRPQREHELFAQPPEK